MTDTMTGKEKYHPYTQDIDWQRGVSSGGARGLNVHDTERWLSAIGGGALLAYGLKRRSWAGLGLAAIGATLVYRGTSGHCPMYEALGIRTNHLGRVKVRTDRAIKIQESITINRTPEELYRFWRRFENLPRFMGHLESIQVKDNHYSHWVVKAPLGMKVEWDTEIINEIPNELIGWRSMTGADVENAGSVRFRPASSGHGTDVRVMLQYDPPGGVIGAALAKILGEDPASQIEDDLRRFKAIMETEEISTAEPPSEQRSG